MAYPHYVELGFSLGKSVIQFRILIFAYEIKHIDKDGCMEKICSKINTFFKMF